MADQIDMQETLLTIYRNTDPQVQFVIESQDDNGNWTGRDVESWTNPRFTVRTEVQASGDPALEITASGSFDFTDNIITLSLTSTEIADLSVTAEHSYKAPSQDYRYDLLVDDENAKTWMIAFGILRVIASVGS